MILEIKSIDQYIQVSKLVVDQKFTDFLIFRFDEVNSDAIISRKAYKQSFFEVSLEFNACCTFQVDGFHCPLDGSRISVIAPDRIQSQQIHKPSTNNNMGYSIFFEPSFLGEYLNFQHHKLNESVLSLDGYPAYYLSNEQLVELDTIFAIIHKEYHLYGNKSREILKRLMEVLFEKLKLWTSNEKGRTSSFVTNQFYQLLQSKFNLNWGVKEYAEKLGVTSKYLSDRLHKESGLTALEHIHALKAKEAKGLLQQTNLSIKEIAFKTGFESSEYFNNFFKKMVGKTPGAYRKNVQ
jgi:AraC-like DNA-binding protein